MKKVLLIGDSIRGGYQQKVQEKLKAAGFTSSIEGEDKADWVLIDAFDVIVHIFRPEVREFYNLEKMWSSVAEIRKK